jgi:hypothetical protein
MKNLLLKLRACTESIIWVNDKTIEQSWNECERGDWMLWLAAKLLDRKIVVKAACAVARTSLKYVKEGELRPLKCIKITERWVIGESTIEEVILARNAAVVAAMVAAVVTAATDAATYSTYAAMVAADTAADTAADAAATDAAYAAAYAASAAAADAADTADAAYADARRESLKQSAHIVRNIINVKMILEQIKIK